MIRDSNVLITTTPVPVSRLLATDQLQFFHEAASKPAIEALMSQMAYTRMGKQHHIEVNLREFGRTGMDYAPSYLCPG